MKVVVFQYFFIIKKHFFLEASKILKIEKTISILIFIVSVLVVALVLSNMPFSILPTRKTSILFAKCKLLIDIGK